MTARRMMVATIRRIAAIALVGLALESPAREPTPEERERAPAAAFDVMAAARYATLVTNGADGRPQARVVDPLVAADRTLWIGTNPLSRKVAEIRHDSRVTLLFFNAAAGEYVTVHGRATVKADAKTRAERWKPEWQPFYKQGPQGKDFLLLEVRPTRLEISSARHKLVNDERTWRPVVIDLP